MSNVFVIAAHPDDEVLGCGGTLLKHINEGDKVYVFGNQNSVSDLAQSANTISYELRTAIGPRVKRVIYD